MSIISKYPSGANPKKVTEEEPFCILYNYRKTKMLRKLRELRK